MIRTVLALVLQVLLAIVVALLAGSVWQGIVGGTPAEAARRLFFFMDIGLGAWTAILVVLAVRRRVLPGIGVTLLAAVAGVVLNALTVLAVGTVQGEGVLLFLGYAIEAGIAFLVAVLITAPIIHRLFGARVKPPREAAPPA